MNHVTAKLLATLLLATSTLSVTTLAAPASEDSAIQIPPESDAVSTVQAVSESKSPVSVDSDQAEGSFSVTYQDKSGQETQATVTAVAPDDAKYVQVNTGGDSLRVRQGPGVSYGILCSVYHGNRFLVTGKTNGWYQIACNGRTGYVSADYVTETDQTEPTPEYPVDTSTLAGQIVAYALEYNGYPYVYATAGPDTFDCSGFTSYVYAHFGYTLNRSSKDQLKNGVPVDKADLQPADLVLFSRDGSVVTHVGLYIGDGQFIHASTSTTGVIISDLNSNYYINHYYAARRIL